MHALRPDLEQPGARRRQQRLDLGGRASHALCNLIQRRAHTAGASALEIRRFIEAEARREHRELLGAERRSYFRAIPCVELAS